MTQKRKRRRKRKLRIGRLIAVILIPVGIICLLIAGMTRLFQRNDAPVEINESDPMVQQVLNLFSINPPYELDSSLVNSLSSQYAEVLDGTTGRTVIEKNGNEIMYPASMTKMMTAIVAIENISDLDQQVEITYDMLAGLYEANASVVGYQIGDTPTVLDLLYGIALPSGADACNAIAVLVSGDVNSYVSLMNQKAKLLGMNNTHFANTTGLHEDNHYTTAHDLAVLLRYCIDNPVFAEVFSTSYHIASPVYSHPYGIEMESTISKSESWYGIEIPGMIGGKTGFTYEAGKCLASWSQVNGQTIIIITGDASDDMNSPDHFIDHGFLLSQIDVTLKNQEN